MTRWVRDVSVSMVVGSNLLPRRKHHVRWSIDGLGRAETNHAWSSNPPGLSPRIFPSIALTLRFFLFVAAPFVMCSFALEPAANAIACCKT